MSPVLRDLDPIRDRAAVARVFEAAADYIWTERGEAADAALTDAFFTDAPPGCDLALSRKLGLAADATTRLSGLADLAFGYPEASSAYLGLMILAPAARGRGQGRFFLRAIEAIARARRARELCLAVLDENPRGLAFWQREGFAIRQRGRPVTLGRKSHAASRLGKAL